MQKNLNLFFYGNLSWWKIPLTSQLRKGQIRERFRSAGDRSPIVLSELEDHPMMTKKKISVEEIEAQATLELPERELMVTVAIFDLANGNSTTLTVPTLSQAFLVAAAVADINTITSVDFFATAIF
jgi:hypothetical protein